ncbi:MAG: EF-hand domain-containing protein [Pseudomonadota bacterium]
MAASFLLTIAGVFATVEVASADCFNGVDTDGSGDVTIDEFAVVASGNCSSAQIDLIFSYADADDDGVLNCDEFVEALILALGC